MTEARASYISVQYEVVPTLDSSANVAAMFTVVDRGREFPNKYNTLENVEKSS